MKGKNLSYTESGVQSLSPDPRVKYESLPLCPASDDFLFGMSHSLPPLSPLWCAQMPPPWFGTLWHTTPSHILPAAVWCVNTCSPSTPRDLTLNHQVIERSALLIFGVPCQFISVCLWMSQPPPTPRLKSLGHPTFDFTSSGHEQNRVFHPLVSSVRVCLME